MITNKLKLKSSKPEKAKISPGEKEEPWHPDMLGEDNEGWEDEQLFKDYGACYYCDQPPAAQVT